MHEDDPATPFAGVFESYAIPNSHPDRAERLRQLCDAVRLVFASLHSPGAASYRAGLASAGYAADAGAGTDGDKTPADKSAGSEDAMAVLVQELVGRLRGPWFYPVLSGTIQSYNYYPISHARPEDGLCSAALGLGTWVVEGGASFQFCPRWPGLQAVPPELAGSGSQAAFCALDAALDSPRLEDGEHAAIAELPIAEAEGYGALDLAASTWDQDDRRLVPGTGVTGPRIIDLAPMLKYDALPLAPAISALLEASETAVGGPVELEFALDADPGGKDAVLFLLQLKKLHRNTAESSTAAFEEAWNSEKASVFLRSCSAMGDGVIEGITDLLWVDPLRFDRSQSREAAREVADFDRRLRGEDRRDILIGPGRWGSRDPWLGVPVEYPDITGARLIVETEIPGLGVDFSFGSHFLRNVTGRGILYMAVPSAPGNQIHWDWLRSLPRIAEGPWCILSRSTAALTVLCDGLGRRGLGIQGQV